MLSEADDQLLTKVSPGTPMGNYLREFWVPCLSSEALEAGGAPRSIQLLGERFVAFRDPNGLIGVLEESCPHRCASLALAWNERSGLRCIYHGWQIDRAGNTIDTPTEPEESVLMSRIPNIGRPAFEAGGLIWTYLGKNRESPPAFPEFEWISMPSAQHLTVIMREECNWAQCLEGVIDSAHSNYLHRGNIRPDEEVAKVANMSVYESGGNIARPSSDGRPRIELDDTEFGFRYGAIREALGSAGSYVRTTHFVAPIYSFFPAPSGWGNMQIFVPIDDSHTLFFYVRYRTDGGEINSEARDQFVTRSGLRPGIDIDDNWYKIRSAGNLWLQDRSVMSLGGGSGIGGVQNEDGAVQESMGPLVDRSQEHLGRTDRAIMHMRRVMIDAARIHDEHGIVRYRVEDGRRYAAIRGEERIIPVQEDWRVVGMLSPSG